MLVNEYISSLSGLSIKMMNDAIETICGIVNFFDDDVCPEFATHVESNRIEYGDWQTNAILASSVTDKIRKNYSPQVIIEPTCGKGNFIVAAVETFDTIQEVYGIDINRNYIEELKRNILQKYLDKKWVKPIKFHLLHANAFTFNWRKIVEHVGDRKVLILGNPPWVTNSEIGKKGGENLPQKQNIMLIKGISAITGKSNFDIAESICSTLFSNFAVMNNECLFALLLKNSTIKKICCSQAKQEIPISCLSQYEIDAQREFDVSVSASLFMCSAGGGAEKQCDVYNFYDERYIKSYGWYNNKFIADINQYESVAFIDGKCEFEWRSGVKHDCANVLELYHNGGDYYNKLGEKIDVEEEYIYPLLKSSDVFSGDEKANTNRYIIITQHKLNEDTEYLKKTAPKTYAYLCRHSAYFISRKSKIYQGRPQFSMFGIGDYTFMPYKIIIAGLYKNPIFRLYTSNQGKCFIPDDTCYYLSFENLYLAQNVLSILNSGAVSDFIKAISFFDSKRPITKDILMRINLVAAAKKCNEKNHLTLLNTHIKEPELLLL